MSRRRRVGLAIFLIGFAVAAVLALLPLRVTVPGFGGGPNQPCGSAISPTSQRPLYFDFCAQPVHDRRVLSGGVLAVTLLAALLAPLVVPGDNRNDDLDALIEEHLRRSSEVSET